jgi:drug/metabolite transporter (DMT)-like permease
MNNKWALLLIGTGAALWGLIGIFVTYLYEVGFTPVQVVAMRALSTVVLLLLYVAYKNRKLLKINVSDSKYFVGTGIVSIVLFNWCLFSAIEETSISVAFILLYTAPAFVTLLSRFVFKEALTTRKVLALAITLIGCSFVIGLVPVRNESITLYGFILGLGSGLFYALYSIFGKAALQKYDPLTVIVYTFLFAASAVIPFSGLWSAIPQLLDMKVWVCILGLGFISTMLPFIFYTKGLQIVESSRASIMATIEPVVASLTGYLFFQEQLNIWQYLGIVLVIAAVIMVQESTRKSQQQIELPGK